MKNAQSDATLQPESAARVRRAASGRASADELRALAQDPEVLVRAAVAINRGCQPDVDRSLAGDSDERVRALLAGRVARLLPDLGEADRMETATHAHAVLMLLVADQAVRVRAAIADAVKEMPQAPREIVLKLAQDAAMQVSEPILKFSPVLTDADLIALIATPPFSGASDAIASREELSDAVTSAIAAHANAPAIRAMLTNASARITEATLDGLLGRAPTHKDWHGPLVRRPALSTASVRALSEFVSAHLLETLAQRKDLDALALHAVRTKLLARSTDNVQEAPSDRTLIVEFLRLKKAGELGEGVLLAAARAGEARRVASILAVSCGVPLAAIDRVVGLRSAKALVSLVWRAGFSMQSAACVQAVVGHLGPAQAILPTKDGGFPLSEDEMRWQLEMLSETEAKPGMTEPPRPLAAAAAVQLA